MCIDIFKKAYQEYWESVESKLVDCPCSMMLYEYRTDASFFQCQWSTMEKIFTEALLNTINGFADQINNLSIWSHVLGKYSDKDQHSLRYEFTRLPLYYCLHKPSEFRDRLIYCSSHLCHQANCFVNERYDDSFDEEHQIKRKTLIKVSKPWARSRELLRSLELIASDDFSEATGQFRNKSQHRVPPSIEFVHTNYLAREKSEDGRVGYTFGRVDSITTEYTLPLLLDQWKLIKEAFQAYWRMVTEQNTAIKLVRKKPP